MKSASVIFSLTKDHQVVKHGVTTVEAMILTSMHHKNVGAAPVVLIPGTEKDVFVLNEKGEDVEVEQKIKTGTAKSSDGKSDIDVFETKKAKVPVSIDDELARLRRKYHPDKVDVLSSKVREFPVDDFNKAITMAVGISLPDNRLSTTEIK